MKYPSVELLVKAVMEEVERDGIKSSEELLYAAGLLIKRHPEECISQATIDDLVRAYIELGDFQRAIEVAERNASHALLEELIIAADKADYIWIVLKAADMYVKFYHRPTKPIVSAVYKRYIWHINKFGYEFMFGGFQQSCLNFLRNYFPESEFKMVVEPRLQEAIRSRYGSPCRRDCDVSQWFLVYGSDFKLVATGNSVEEAKLKARAIGHLTPLVSHIPSFK